MSIKVLRDKGVSNREAARLLEDELSEREQRPIRTSLKLSGLPTGHTLGNFDFGFAFQPAIERGRIETLATCAWLRALDPVRAKLDFATIVDEVVQQFTSRLGIDVSISVEIRARSGEGFDEALQRTIKENCNVLKFGSAEFEEGE